MSAPRGCGARTCPTRSGRLHGLSAVCTKNAQSTWQRGRYRRASLRMRGIREYASLHAAHPVAAPAVPLEAAEPPLQLTREQLLEEGIVFGPSGWTFEIICAACQSSDAALDVTLEHVNLILSGEIPRESFLPDGLMIGFERPGGGVRPIANQRDVVSRCRGLRAADIRAGCWRAIGPASGGGRHTRCHGDCGACACFTAGRGP